jgi:hypothetical protein
MLIKIPKKKHADLKPHYSICISFEGQLFSQIFMVTLEWKYSLDEGPKQRRVLQSSGVGPRCSVLTPVTRIDKRPKCIGN